MTVSIELYLIPGAEVVEEGDSVEITAFQFAHRAPMRLVETSENMRAALQGLAGDGVTLEGLVKSLLRTDGAAGVGVLKQTMERFDQNGMLCRRLLNDDIPIASLEPRSTLHRQNERSVEGGTRYALSRFASFRNDNGRMLLSSPLGYADVFLHSTAAQSALFELARPLDAEALATAVSGLDEESALALMNLLDNAKALVEGEPGAANDEQTRPELAQWEPEDLLFHAHSRLGRYSDPYGGTFPFKDQFEPLPVVKPPMSDDVTPLYAPDLDDLRNSDKPFTEVLERRRSNREQADDPITLEQLGEFLYRTARVKKSVPEVGVSFRPSPGGGALHELEVYPLVSHCDGLDAGLYHYNPGDHNLEKIAEPNQYLAAVAQMGAIAGTLDEPPQVLLVIAARFQRMQLKYRSMTYAATLKNVGCLYQTMYLVATAMGLAPCALGGGHSDIFSIAAGLDYLAETSVGEFMLGSAAADSLDKNSWDTPPRVPGGAGDSD